MPAPKNNKHARKPKSKQASAVLGPFRVHPKRKAAYRRSARGMNFTQWVFAGLDKKSGYRE